MKKLALLISAIAVVCVFSSCVESHDCSCIVNGQVQTWEDYDEDCASLESNYIMSKDVPGGGVPTGAVCTEI
jgi:hypothetical protein